MTSGRYLPVIITFDVDKIPQAFRLLILILVVMVATTATVVTVVIVMIAFTVAMVVTGSFIAIFPLDRFLAIVPVVVVPGFLSSTVL